MTRPDERDGLWTVLRRKTSSCDDSDDCDDSSDCDSSSRRQFIVTGAAGTVTVGLAGCLGLGDDYEEEYEQSQTQLEETETALSNLEDDLENTQSELEERDRNHVLTSSTYAVEGEVPNPDLERFVRTDSPQSVFVQGMVIRFQIGIHEANTGAAADTVDSAVVEIPDADVTLDLEWDSDSETWQAIWEDTEDAEPGVYTYTVEVTLDGEVRQVDTHQSQFEILEYVGQTYSVEYLDPGDNVSGLDGSATIDVSESTELLIAGEEQDWNLPYNCRVGRCGRCVAHTEKDVDDVAEMTENHVLPDELIEQGYLLTCTGQPRDEFSIETDVYNEIRDEL